MPWYRRFTNTFRQERLGADLDREFAFHLAERMDELRACGLDEGQALATARRQFGNLAATRERSLDMHASVWLDAVLRNIRRGARSLLRTPGVSAAVIATLALGIGANSAVFSVIDAVLLRPLPFPHGDQLMWITETTPRTPETPVAPVRVEDWNRMNSTFQAIAGYYMEDASETSGELPEKLRRAFVTARFLDVWRVRPALGREVMPADLQSGGGNVVLITDRLWRRRFGGRPDVIGKRLRFQSTSATVIGVMPASFLFPDPDVDLWWPMPGVWPERNATWLFVVGRLKEGVSVAQAQADLSTVQARLDKQFPDTDAKLSVRVEPLKDETVGEVRRSLWIVFGSVSLLLLIACANVTALLLSRAMQRKQEIAIRRSLGASRLSVAGQMFTETVLLAGCGAGVGLLVATAAPKLFRAMAGDLPRMREVDLDWRIAIYALICTLLATFLCGMIPAIRGAGLGTSRGEVSGRHRIQWTLVGGQIALAVALLAGAGLLLRSLQALGRVSPGFDPDHVLTFHISGSYAETMDYPGLDRRIDGTLEFLAAIPGVRASATAAELPGMPVTSQESELTISGGSNDPDTKIIAGSRFVSAGYFATMSIPLLAGEACPSRTTGVPGHLPDVLVNRSFAERYLAGSPAIGRRITGVANTAPGNIRGLVGDAREEGLNHEPIPTVYWCISAPGPSPYFLIRTAGEPSAMIATVRRKLREIEPLRSVSGFAPLRDKLDEAVAGNRLRTLLLSFFAGTAVLLACLGIYSTIGYLVVISRREIGLRMALGAARETIVARFLAKGLAVTGASCIAGLGLALASTRLLAGMLYGVSASDPATLSGVILLVVAVGSMASLIPAIRAANVEPMRVLRDD